LQEVDETLRDVLEEEVGSSDDEHVICFFACLFPKKALLTCCPCLQSGEPAGEAADVTPKKTGWLSGIVGAVKTVGR
jgi:hypothetical protein